MTYVCSDCGERVTMAHGTLSRQGDHGETVTGEGLGTATCSKHPFRFVTVVRDLSGGKEAARAMRAVPMSVKRHTKVRRKYGT